MEKSLVQMEKLWKNMFIWKNKYGTNYGQIHQTNITMENTPSLYSGKTMDN